VADTLNVGLPSFVDRVRAYADDFCVFGSICEPHEMIWRIMGTENVLLKLGESPGRMARFIERLGDFAVGIVEGQMAAAGGALAGIYIWGDIAYDKGMFFSPDYWRSVYMPQLRRICEAAHAGGLKTIYHGCGDSSEVFDDMIAAGVDAYNPLEAKAGLDVVDLKRRYGNRWAFNGNVDVRVLATNDPDQIRREVLRKLNAAKGGGYIVQSDHSVPDNVTADGYDYMIELVREYGRYPLDLGEFEEEI
jgi:uroporphyrinogen decarboxylase